MTRHIVVAITPHEDGRCGKCDYDTDCVFLPGSVIARVHRLPECLAAEAKLTALIEAGEELAILCPNADGEYGSDESGISQSHPAWVAWDRAVAEIKGGR